MIYHPEGVLRPTPANTSNTTEFVYDYFIKDYLGNVRAVILEEDATETQKFLATLEAVWAEVEQQNYDNLDDTRHERPAEYPVTGSVVLNEQIAYLTQANGTEMGPLLVMPVKRGDRVSLSTDYFYTEDAPGVTYDNLTTFVSEILISLAASGSGVLQLNEGQLVDIASGVGDYGLAIADLLNSQFDDTDLTKPHAYLVWMQYDNSMNLMPEGSGALRATNANELERLIEEEIPILTDGYLHAVACPEPVEWVSNGSAKGVSFDNILVTSIRGKLRQINDYYPFGLAIAGLNGIHDDYLNKYTSKELQTSEFANEEGLEMYDFGSRFYDAQLGRWYTPDPAEQFANPYLAMGNNPVMYVDPNGEVVFIIPLVQAIVIGAGIGAVSYTAQVGFSDGGFSNWENKEFWKSVGRGALSGAAAYGIGLANLGAMNANFAHGISQGLVAEVTGGDFETGFGSAVFSSFVSATLIKNAGNFGENPFANIAASGLAGGIGAYASGGDFWQGVGVGASVAGFNHLMHLPGGPDDPPKNKKKNDDINSSFRIRGPYEGPGSNVANIKAFGNSIDRFIYGEQGFENLAKIGEIVISNAADIVLWNRMSLPPMTPGLENISEPNITLAPPQKL